MSRHVALGGTHEVPTKDGLAKCSAAAPDRSPDLGSLLIGARRYGATHQPGIITTWKPDGQSLEPGTETAMMTFGIFPCTQSPPAGEHMDRLDDRIIEQMAATISGAD